MSNFHPNAAHSSSSSLPPAPQDFAPLAAALQEAAQALLTLSAVNAPEESEEAASKPPVRKNEGEIRSFYFSPATVNQERELLRKYRAQDFQGLLEEAHTLLVGLVKLMQSVHKDVRVRGHVIASLGAQLSHASALVLRIRNVYAQVTPVQR